jgi:hypothetical protein
MDLDNDASDSSPAKTRLQRAEQALMWALYELNSDTSGHGGVQDACDDIYPELNTVKLAKKGYPLNWPESYNPENDE